MDVYTQVWKVSCLFSMFDPGDFMVKSVLTVTTEVIRGIW